MFKKISSTSFPPDQPILVYDGDCGFCKYWMIRWKMHSEEKINYQPYQEVFQQFPDIPLSEFKKASRLIEPDGTVYNGPDSAFRSYYLSRRKRYLHIWYKGSPFFALLVDSTYHFISTHRSLMFNLSRFFFGKNPSKLSWEIPIFCVLVLLLIVALAFIL